MDRAAMKELLLSLAKFNDEVHVAALLEDMANDGKVEPEVLVQVVRNFLGCQNLDAALGYVKLVLEESCQMPQELVIGVIKASTEAELTDDSAVDGTRPRAWEALDVLETVKLTEEALLLFLEWSSRQTPVDVAMATRVEALLRKEGALHPSAYDALVRVHASSEGDKSKAFACFDEFVLMRSRGTTAPLEDGLVGMISSCMEAQSSDLAKHMFDWAFAGEQCLGTMAVFSATLKVLVAAKQWEQACAIYETACSNKDLVFDEALLGHIANCASQAGRNELARILVKSSRKINAQSHISLMRSSAQEGNIQQVLELLEELEQNGEAETVAYNVALDVCVSSRDAEATQKVLKEMQTSGYLDVASYNIMLKQCLSEGASLKASKEVLQEMHKRGLEPNTATYNSLLSCAMTSGDFAGVWQIVEDLERSGQCADIYTLSILFKGYRRERRTMDTESVDKALSLIRNYAVKVDDILVNVILEACLALKDLRCLKKALDTFWDSGWVIPKQASMHTYGLLIKSYGQIQGLTEIWQLWKEVTEDKGLEPSEQLYGQMLDVLVGNDCLKDALTLFQDMKAAFKGNLNTQGFAVAYAMIIRGFAQQKDCARALECYEEMKSHGTKASQVVLNTLIDACSRVGDMAAASKLFKDMEDSQCVPDLITYSTLIKGYCISNDLEQALQLFGVMQEKGIRPDAIVFNSVLDGCAKRQMPALCEQVIKDMEAAGVVPSNHSASILIKLHGRGRDLDAAFRVINEMPRKYGFWANNAVYTCLMSACITNGCLDRAMELRLRMLDEGVYPDDRTYSTLLRGALRACSIEQCVLLVSAALDQKGVKARQLLDDDTVRSVLLLIQRQNEWQTYGQELSNRLRSNGIHVRMPLPPDSCNRNDGFGRSQRDSYGEGKRNFGGARDYGASKEGRFQQQNQHQYPQQRRH
jgi:pentatricopeptide repeat protein